MKQLGLIGASGSGPKLVFPETSVALRRIIMLIFIKLIRAPSGFGPSVSGFPAVAPTPAPHPALSLLGEKIL